MEILGIDTKVLLSAGDKEADKAALKEFASKYEKMNRWVDMTDGSRVLYIGADNFVFPVPLAKNASGQWHFDACCRRGGNPGARHRAQRAVSDRRLLCARQREEIYFANGGALG